MRLVTLNEAPNADGQPLFVEFVNTLHWYVGAPIELIGSESDLAGWLAEYGLPAMDVTGWLPEVQRLRAHVRGVTEALASRRNVAPADMEAIQAALSAPTGRLRLTDFESAQPRLATDVSCLCLTDPSSAPPHLSLATEASDLALFSFRVALSVALFLRSPRRQRLKICANPGCGFAFVDTSINATRRWCFMRYCGNRVKVRAFRGRQRAGDGSR